MQYIHSLTKQNEYYMPKPLLHADTHNAPSRKIHSLNRQGSRRFHKHQGLNSGSNHAQQLLKRADALQLRYSFFLLLVTSAAQNKPF